MREQIEPLTRELLAQRGAKPARRTINRYVTQLRAACLRDQQGGCLRAARVMMKAGITAADVADLYVPAVARQLGTEWVDDQTSFAEVTIGSSRLQSLLHDLGAEETFQPYGDAPAIVVATAAQAQHTLGAIVLVGQIRRLGFAVHLMLGATPSALQQDLRGTGYDAVFLSASLGDNPLALRRLVDAARSAAPSVPLVLGGTILESGDEVVSAIRAPHATSTLDEALQLCGLALPARYGSR